MGDTPKERGAESCKCGSDALEFENESYLCRVVCTVCGRQGQWREMFEDQNNGEEWYNSEEQEAVNAWNKELEES